MASTRTQLAEMSAGPGGEEVIEEEPIAAPASMARGPAIALAPEADLEGPDAELLRSAMASIDSDEVVEEEGGAPLPELEEEPFEPPAPRRAEPGPARAGPADLTDELEEADFFAQQGLLADAHDALLQLRARHPGHPVVEARLADVERRQAARAAPPRPPPVAPAIAEPRSARRSPTLIEPSAEDGAHFDLGADLAEELDRAPDLGAVDDEFQYSVEDVFNQFKRGVAETVTAEDSDTHYDLGIAYKEMGLVDDAVNEFETALRGNNRKKEIDSLSMIAHCRMSQGRPHDALEPLRRALRSDYLTKESAKAIHYELGLVHEELGEREEALWCFQKVARSEPSYRDTAGRVAALGGGPGRPPPGMAAPASRAVAGAGRPALANAGRQAPSQAATAKPPPGGLPGPKKNIGFL